MRETQLKDVKATLSAVADQAVAGEPTIITRHGRKGAVLVSFEECGSVFPRIARNFVYGHAVEHLRYALAA